MEVELNRILHHDFRHLQKAVLSKAEHYVAHQVKHWTSKGIEPSSKKHKVHHSEEMASKKRIAGKNSSSHTKTKVMQEVQVNTSDLKSGVDQHYTRVILNKHRHKVSPGLVNYSDNYAGHVFQGNSGFQTVQTMFYLGTFSQWRTSTGANPQVYQSGQSWLDLNPSRKLPGSSLFPNGTVPANDKMVLTRAKCVIDFMNTASTIQYVTLYVVSLKDDNAYAPDQLWATAMTNNADGVGTAVFPTATTNVGQTVGSEFISSGLTMVGASPLNTPGFRNIYRLLGKHSFILAQGASHRWHLDVIANLLGDDSKLLNVGLGNPKGSLSILMCAYGGMVVDSVDDLEQATYGVCSVRYIVNRKMTFRQVAGATTPAIKTKIIQQNISTNGIQTNQKVDQTTDQVSGGTAVVGT